MQNTIAQPANGGDSDAGDGVEMTPLGGLVLILVLGALCLAGWRYAVEPTLFGAPPAAKHVAAKGQPTAAQAPQGTSFAPAQSREKEEPQPPRVSKEQNDHAIKLAVSRAVSVQSLQQIADLDAGVRALEETVNSLPKTTQPSVRAPRSDALDTAKALHRKADEAKATASVDVNTLPIETVTAASLNVTGFGQGVVGIGSQRLSVGQAIAQGEVIVAIDNESHSIVTSRRIINVTN